MEGKRPRGNPRRKMLDLLMEQKDKRSVMWSEREEQRAGSDGVIISGTCLRAEHTRRRMMLEYFLFGCHLFDLPY